MLVNDLTILVVVVVVGWYVWRRLRRASSADAPTRSAPRSRAATRSGSPPDTEQALALLASCARPEGAGELTTVLHARVTDEGGGDWQFQFANGSCALVRGPADRAALTISATGRSWRDLAAKRTSFASAMLKGTLQAEGDTGLLMKLDAAFAGPPNEAVIGPPSPVATPPPADARVALASSGSDGANPPGRLASPDLIATIRAARTDPNLSAAERQAAILAALGQGLGPAAARLGNWLDGPEGAAGPADTAAAYSADVQEALKRAIQTALANLPPDATREQKMTAVRVAIATVPEAAPFGALLDVFADGNWKAMAGKLAGKAALFMLESAFEGLTPGD
jgi:hypothetical protein